MGGRSWAISWIARGVLGALVLAGCDGADGTGDADMLPVTLAWDAPTTNEDGTPLTDLAGYIVYHGPAAGEYTGWMDVGNVTVATLRLAAGRYRFAVAAYDREGNESEPSDPIEATLP